MTASSIGIIPERIGGNDGRKIMSMNAIIENLGLKPRPYWDGFS